MSLLKDLKSKVHQNIQSIPKVKVDIVKVISEQFSFPISVVKKGISQKLLSVNGNLSKNEMLSVTLGDVVTFQQQEVFVDFPKKISNFDLYVSELLKKFSKDAAFTGLSFEYKNKVCAYIIEYFSEFGYDVGELAGSPHNQNVFRLLDEFYKTHFSFLSQTKAPKRKELVDALLAARDREITSFEQFITSVKAGLYNTNVSSIYKDFNKINTNKSFIYLVKPILEYQFDPLKLVSKIINDYSSVKSAGTANEKFEIKSRLIKEYKTIQEVNFSNDTHKVTLGLKELVDYFLKKIDEAVGFQDTGVAELVVAAENRTYNFEDGHINVYLTIENRGTGVAKNIAIKPVNNTVYILPQQELLELLPPKETRKVKFSLKILPLQIKSKQILISFKLKWINDFGKESFSKQNPLEIVSQKTNLPWDTLLMSKPYDIAIVDDPNKLFGRDKLIEDLKWNIEKNRNITSHIIYGQKRVGKSSIIKTLETIYKDNRDIVFIYKIIADVKNTDANRTFHNIGEQLAKILKSEFRRKNRVSEELLPDLRQFSFGGSLSPLIEIIDLLSELNQNLRVIIALDEFDELNKEFFEDNEIGKTFALNIGKGLNQKNNIGFVLIGSENMVTKKIHGMRLNTFQNKKVDTFDKESEFGEYCKIITEPTKSCLTFAPEVLDLLYDYTNGNPYFTNMLSDKIFRAAYDKRISFIDFDLAKNTIDHFIEQGLSSFEFEHFWKDGLLEGDLNYQKELDRRKRLLTAFAEVRKGKDTCTWPDLKKKIKYPKKFAISEHQMEDTLNEFMQRGIIKTVAVDKLHIVPKLFENWLLANGIYHIIATLEDKDEILDKVQQEQKLHVSNDELKELMLLLNNEESRQAITGMRNFLNQFSDNASQRLIADFLKKTFVISSTQMLDHLKRARNEIWGQIEVSSGEKNIRKDAEIICFDDSFVQNKSYAEFVRKTFGFSATKLIKQAKDVEKFNDEIEKFIVFEPLIDCPYYYRNEIAAFLKKIHPTKVRSIKIFFLTFVITDEAKAAIEELLSNHFAFDYQILHLKVVQRIEISPFHNNNESINNSTLKVFSPFFKEVSDDSSLVKIGNIIPYQCFPFLWNNEILNYYPLYSNPTKLETHHLRMRTSNNLKNLKFESESNKIEFKASFAEPAYNWKEIKKASTAYKNIPTTKAEALSEYRTTLEELFSLKLPSKKRNEVVNHIKHSIAKNLSAFANTVGGDIYVGIEDDFTVSGLKYDFAAFKTKEDIRRAFSNLIEKYIGLEHSSVFDLEFIKVTEDVEVLKINVAKSHKEVWVKIDKDGKVLEESQWEIYIREHHGARQLHAKDYHEWKK